MQKSFVSAVESAKSKILMSMNPTVSQHASSSHPLKLVSSHTSSHLSSTARASTTRPAALRLKPIDSEASVCKSLASSSLITNAESMFYQFKSNMRKESELATLLNKPVEANVDQRDKVGERDLNEQDHLDRIRFQRLQKGD